MEKALADLAAHFLLNEEEGDEADEFMRNMGFDEKGGMYSLHGRADIEDDLERLKQAVVKRTAEIMPQLVQRGLVTNEQAHIVAKFVLFYTVSNSYDPKLYHVFWTKKYRQLRKYIDGHTGWSKSLR